MFCCLAKARINAHAAWLEGHLAAHGRKEE